MEDVNLLGDSCNIRVNTKQFSLRNVLSRIEENRLELIPNVQRSRAWKPSQKSRLIESVILEIPLLAFYFAEDGSGKMRVLDGVQRLSILRDFVSGESRFPLRSLEYLKDHEGQTFEDLPLVLRRRIHHTQIVAHVIDPTTPVGIAHNIAKRINARGSSWCPAQEHSFQVNV